MKDATCELKLLMNKKKKKLLFSDDVCCYGDNLRKESPVSLILTNVSAWREFLILNGGKNKTMLSLHTGFLDFKELFIFLLHINPCPDAKLKDLTSEWCWNASHPNVDVSAYCIK